MMQILHIKNMVCDRCKSTVLRELKNLGYTVDSLELGQVVLNENTPIDNSKLEGILKKTWL
jgi:copper chaperone CopZ